MMCVSFLFANSTESVMTCSILGMVSYPRFEICHFRVMPVEDECNAALTPI